MAPNHRKFTKPGSVSRITMKNFMTYRHETIYPGPNFNVTVGPNGSGKSSIVTALSICLGGDIKSLNRQSDLISLINNETGADAAEVEVELFQAGRILKNANLKFLEGIDAEENIKIKTVLTRNGYECRQTWQVNGKHLSMERLAELTDKLQIQPGNLCQFLPQDVVREFPQMTHQDIFYNTVKAVGDLNLLHTYEDLKDIQRRVESREADIETKSKTIESLQKKENKLGADRKIWEARKEIEKKKFVAESALKWERFKTLRKQVKETRDKQRAATETVTRLEAEREPVKQFLKNYEEKVAVVKEKISTAETNYSKICRKVEEFEIVNLEDELDRLVEQKRDLTEQEEGRIEKKRSLQKEINELKELLRTQPLDPTIEHQIKEKRDKRCKYEAAIDRQNQMCSDLEFQVKNTKREIEKLERKLTDLKNTKSQKLNLLQKENRDAYEGVKWLELNRDKFKAAIHDPIMLCLDVKDKNHAKYVETHVGRADLEGFVCEDADDANHLLKQLREHMKLRKISVFHCQPEGPEKFRKPYDRSKLEDYDFDCYISDMYDAPPAVNAYLCRHKNLHEVPVFKQENQFSDELKTMFHNYYIHNYKFVTRRSKYSREFSTGMEDIGGRKVFRLSANADKAALDQTEKELQDKRKNLDGCSSRWKRTQETLAKIKEEEEKLSYQITELTNRKKEHFNRQNELAMKEKTLESLAEPQCNIEAEKAKIDKEKASIVFRLSSCMADILELTLTCNRNELEKRMLYLELQAIESSNRENIDRLADIDRELDAAKTEEREVSAKWETHRRQLQEVHNEARKATGVQSEQIKYKPPEEWQKKFEALGTCDENVYQVMVEEYESELKSMKKIPEETMIHMEEIKKKLEAAQEEVANLTKGMEKDTVDAGHLRRKWVHGVKHLVNQINNKFSAMMAELGYSGQITLYEGKREIDFSSYGIKIMVKFRTDDDFQELSKGSQSGGEKSVTTAVYMMALQELTQVPFRCVDEINQGMDEKNERNVWAMLLKVCQKYQAQYFYMAPKFPYSLPFDDQVTVLICNSGCVGKKSNRDFNTNKFVHSARKQRSRMDS